jgi:hypothetical protein
MSGMAAHAGRASSEFRCREEVRQRIALLHGTWRGRPDAAHNKAIAAIGATVRRQALIMGFSVTFAVIGTLLAVAAIVLLFARKMGRSGAARALVWFAVRLARCCHFAASAQQPGPLICPHIRYRKHQGGPSR